MKYISEERLKELANEDVRHKSFYARLISEECKSLTPEMIVNELRPMSEARALGVQECLGVVEISRDGPEYWQVDAGGESFGDRHYLGWVALPPPKEE